MMKTLFQLLRLGRATEPEVFPALDEWSRGLPAVTDVACTECGACVAACPTRAVEFSVDASKAPVVSVDLGRCLACGDCTQACPTGTLVDDRGTRMAARSRSELVRRAPSLSPSGVTSPPPSIEQPFRRSIHLREVSTGDNASDLEAGASNNPIYDANRFGIHFVASPRFADALLVTGPVGQAMQEPLRRCHDAMAEPRMVIAAGAAAISGVPWEGGYAQANGVDAVLPVSVYVPGNPPHPWYLLHGILLAMGHPAATPNSAP